MTWLKCKTNLFFSLLLLHYSTQGRDRGSYYNERFLRGLPHLAKEMKRCDNIKQEAEPHHEPDLYKISKLFPLPEKVNDSSILLLCTMKGGPMARMPIYTGSLSLSVSTDSKPSQLTPRDQHSLWAFEQSLGASEACFHPTYKVANVGPPILRSVPDAALAPTCHSVVVNVGSTLSALSAANQLAFSRDVA
jgi:hypothetical protein